MYAYPRMLTDTLECALPFVEYMHWHPAACRNLRTLVMRETHDEIALPPYWSAEAYSLNVWTAILSLLPHVTSSLRHLSLCFARCAG
jgi:hypothetical protein